jgi:hypothetical protein
MLKIKEVNLDEVEEQDIRTNIVQMQVNMMGIMINLNKKEEIKIKIKNLVVK